MVISHKFKYLFVELPRTGSTAISKELRNYYDGHLILRKHSTYHDFLKVASEEEKKYFVFSCIRNPMDDAVSRYFKLKTNHRERYTDPAKQRRRKTIVEAMETRLFKYIRSSNVDFSTFFRRAYIFPYNNWASMSHRDFDYVIHFENLSDEFTEVLKRIGIEPVRQLPVINKTSSRSRSFASYYTPQIAQRAKRIFGPFMKQWGYEMPAELGDADISWWDQKQYEMVNVVRVFYWKYLRYRI